MCMVPANTATANTEGLRYRQYIGDGNGMHCLAWRAMVFGRDEQILGKL